MNRLIILALCAVLLVQVKSQGNPDCTPFKDQPLNALLENPPRADDANMLLNCLDKKMILQFTVPKSIHIPRVLDCMKDPNHEGCTLKGYQNIATILSSFVRENQSRLASGRSENTNLDLLMRRLRRHHKEALTKGITILTEGGVI